LIRNSVKFGLECRNLPIRPTGKRFYPLGRYRHRERALLKELGGRTEQVEARSHELVKLNQQLEQRIADQVGEIERMSRLRRFLPPQVADLIVASGSEKQREAPSRDNRALLRPARVHRERRRGRRDGLAARLPCGHRRIIIKYSGTLERYAGDRVIMAFNDPVPAENPALQAVLMALEVRHALGALTSLWSPSGTRSALGSVSRTALLRSGLSASRAVSTMPASGPCLTSPLAFATAKPGQILISPRVLTKVEKAVRVESVGEFELQGIRRPPAAHNVVAL
jgi:adenylate cyclase